MAAENLTIAQLFFVHIRAVCMYVKVKYPALTILMWDDMLRFLELPVLVGKICVHEKLSYTLLICLKSDLFYKRPMAEH